MTVMLLRTGALDDRAVATGGASAAACAAAGATIVEPGASRTLVLDAGALFGAGGIGGLRAALAAFLAPAAGDDFSCFRFTLR